MFKKKNKDAEKQTQKLDTDEKEEQKKRRIEKEKKKKSNQITKADIQDIMPFSFDEDRQLMKTIDGQYIQMIRIKGTNIFGFRENDQQTYMHQMELSFNNIVEKGQLYAYEQALNIDAYMEDIEYLKNHLNILDPQQEVMYNILEEEQHYLKQEIYSYDLKERVFLYILKDDSLKRLNNRVNDVVSCFAMTNAPEVLDIHEMMKVIYNYYNPTKTKIFDVFKDECVDFMDFMKPTYLGISGRGWEQNVEIDGVWNRFLFVSDLKKEPMMALLNYLATYPNVTFSLHFEKAASDAIQKQLDKELKAIDNNYSNERSNSQKQQLQDKYEKINALSEDIAVSGEIPFYITVAIRVQADSEKQLRDRVNELNKYIVSLGIKLEEGVFEPLGLLTTVSPLCINKCRTYAKTTTASTIGWMYPFVYENLFDRVKARNTYSNYYYPAVYIGHTINTLGTVFYDNFEKLKTRSNYNEFIIGNSGMGKTTLIMLLMYFRFGRGYKQYSIDVEGKELPKLAYYLKGDNIDCSNGDKGRINPLHIRFNIPDNENTDEDDNKIPLNDIFPLGAHIRFLRQFVGAYLNNAPEYTILHQRKLENTFENVYRNAGIDFSTSAAYIVNNFKNEDYPIFKDVYDDLYNALNLEQKKTEKDFQEITTIKECIAFIKPLCVGADASIFNGPTNISLDNKFINFNLSGLQDNTASPVLKAQYFNVLSFIWTDIISDTENLRKQLYADEISVIMDQRFLDVMLFVMQIVKRIRKYYGGLTTATQQISDYLKSSVKEQGEAIIANSAYQFYFNIGLDGVQYFKGTNLLPESEMEFIQYAGIGQCYAKIGSSTAMRMAVEIDPNVFEIIEQMKG